MIAWEHDLAWNQFSKSASSWPHIHLVSVLMAWKHNFRGPVVPGDNVLCQILIFLFAQVTTQPKITETRLALVVLTRFWVHSFHSKEYCWVLSLDEWCLQSEGTWRHVKPGRWSTECARFTVFASIRLHGSGLFPWVQKSSKSLQYS